jgi:hypothetical protein
VYIKPKLVKEIQKRFSYNTYSGTQETTRKLSLLPLNMRIIVKRKLCNGGRSFPFPNVSGPGEGTNWQDEVS